MKRQKMEEELSQLKAERATELRNQGGGNRHVAAPVFEPAEQAAQYDKDGSYVRLWLGDAVAAGQPLKAAAHWVGGSGEAPSCEKPDGMAKLPPPRPRCAASPDVIDQILPGSDSSPQPLDSGTPVDVSMAVRNAGSATKPRSRASSTRRKKKRVQGAWSEM